MHTLKLQIHEKAFAKVLRFLESFDNKDLSIVENDFIPTEVEEHVKKKTKENSRTKNEFVDIDDFELGLESIIKQYENRK